MYERQEVPLGSGAVRGFSDGLDLATRRAYAAAGRNGGPAAYARETHRRLAKESGDARDDLYRHDVRSVKERAITLDVTVTIPNCVSDYLEADIYGVRGNTVLNQFYLDLDRGEDGSYTGSVTLPLDPEVGLELKWDQGLLYRCDSMAELLPVQMKWASGSTTYNQELGLIYQAEWDVELTNPQGEAVEVTDTEYRVYQNKELVFSGPCYIPKPHEGEKMMEGWGLPCKAGDIVDLRYTCTDKFGLSYEFPLRSWRITASKAQERWPSSFAPTLTWPE